METRCGDGRVTHVLSTDEGSWSIVLRGEGGGEDGEEARQGSCNSFSPFSFSPPSYTGAQNATSRSAAKSKYRVRLLE